MITKRVAVTWQAADIPWAQKVAGILMSQLQKRFGLATMLADGRPRRCPLIILEEGRVPTGAKDVEAEGYAISTEGAGAGLVIRIRGQSRGLLYGVGRLLRAARRQGGGVEFPRLHVTESPAMPYRGIYHPIFFAPDLKGRPFNAYSALVLIEERYADFEEYLTELMLWGLNTLGLWPAEMMDFAWDSAAGQRLWRKYKRVLAIARSLRLKIHCILTVNMVPPAYTRKYPGLAVTDGPVGCWSQLTPSSALCPSRPAARRILLESRRRLIEQFLPCDTVEVFPTDPGGCGCERCRPYWKVYFDLAEEILRVAAKGQVPNRAINLWYFWNRDARKLARAAAASKTITAVCTQGPWQEDFAERMAITDRIARKKRIIFWPDITMIGGWGVTGAYPNAQGLRNLFSRTQGAYGVLPYTEGRYDDFNKFIMLVLAWRPGRTLHQAIRTVLEGVANEPMPDVALEAMLCLERGEFAKGKRALSKAGRSLSRVARRLPEWYAMDFYARYGDLVYGTIGHIEPGRELLERVRQSKAKSAQRTAAAVKKAARLFRREADVLERRLRALAAELPTLYRTVNGLQRKHDLNCGTRILSVKELGKLASLPEIRKALRALSA